MSTLDIFLFVAAPTSETDDINVETGDVVTTAVVVVVVTIMIITGISITIIVIILLKKKKNNEWCMKISEFDILFYTGLVKKIVDYS